MCVTCAHGGSYESNHGDDVASVVPRNRFYLWPLCPPRRRLAQALTRSLMKIPRGVAATFRLKLQKQRLVKRQVKLRPPPIVADV